MTSLLQVDSSELQTEVLKACLKSLIESRRAVHTHDLPATRRGSSTFIRLTWAWKHRRSWAPALSWRAWAWLPVCGRASMASSPGDTWLVPPRLHLSTCFPSCLTAPRAISSSPNAGNREQDFFPHSYLFFLTSSLVFHLYLQLAVKHLDIKCKTYKHMCHVKLPPSPPIHTLWFI